MIKSTDLQTAQDVLETRAGLKRLIRSATTTRSGVFAHGASISVGRHDSVSLVAERYPEAHAAVVAALNDMLARHDAKLAELGVEVVEPDASTRFDELTGATIAAPQAATASPDP